MKPCVGFPGYFVNELGEIWKEVGGILQRRRSAIVTRQRATYEQITLRKDGQYFTKSVHRLVLEGFRGPCPPECESRHLNGNSIDNRLVNLEWGTRQENTDDKRQHGTMCTNERNGGCKLSRRQVEEMRSLRPTHTLKQLATMFHISLSQAKRIVYRTSWS